MATCVLYNNQQGEEKKQAIHRYLTNIQAFHTNFGNLFKEKNMVSKKMCSKATCILFLFLAINIAYALDPDLVAWYQFDEGSGTTLIDSVGGHNATVNGSGGVWVTGKAGGAYNFNATAYAQASGLAAPGGTEQTVTFWFSGNESIVNGSGYPAGPAFYSNSGTVNYMDTSYNTGLGAVAATFVAGSGYSNQTLPVALNSVIKYGWHHLATVKNATAGTMEVYLDGEPMTTATGMTESIPASTNLFIGSSIYGGVIWNGAIDDMRIYTRALTQTEIAAVMNTSGIDPHLIAWYKFDEGAGTTLTDSIAGNNATVTNWGGGSGNVYVAGKLGGAYNFNAAVSGWNSGGAAMPGGTQQTVAFWFKGNDSIVNGSGYPAGPAFYSNSGTVNYMDTSYSTPLGAVAATVIAGSDYANQTSPVALDSVIKYGWHHITTVKDATAGTMKMYLDGVLMTTATGMTETIPASTNFFIGSSIYGGAIWDGALDDMRIYDRELTQNEITTLANTYDSDKAYYPNPGNNTTRIDPNTVLTWNAGTFAASHNVYFGTSFTDVNSATTASAAYKGNQTSCSYDPVTDLNQTYYWRIDEVNGVNVWKGDVWNFTTSKGTAPTDFYVATDGDDNNPGTSTAQPFQTIANARDTIRLYSALPAGGVKVWIRGGTYYLTAPLIFEPQDSGASTKPITYLAYPGEKPVISGGKVISGTWTSIGSNKYTITIPDAGSWWFRQLWCDGQRCQRARWPNPGSALLAITAVSPNMITLTMNQTISGSNLSANRTELVMHNLWTVARARVASKNGYTVSTSTVCGDSDNDSLKPFVSKAAFMEHNPDYIDQNTEWFLDPATGLLTYQSPAGTTPASSTFVAPKLKNLIIIEGDQNNTVKYLVFKGLSLKDTKWDLPDYGYVDLQAGHYHDNGSNYYLLPAAIHAIYAENCAFTRCSIANTGASGIGFSEGCNFNQVSDCEFYDVGGSGVVNGERSDLDTELVYSWANADAPNNNTISNNYLHKIGNEWFGCVGIFDAFSTNTNIVNNSIADSSYNGIELGIGQSANCQKNAMVSKNHVQHVMTKCQDGGGIYNIGPQNPDITDSANADDANIMDNWVHDVNVGVYTGGAILDLRYQNHGIMLDGMSADIYVLNNVTYGIYNGGQPNADYFKQTMQGYEPVRITEGTNYWNNPATSGTPLSIKNAAGTVASAPSDLIIAWSADYSSFTVTGNSEAWAQLDSAYINENSQTVLSSLTIEKNGAIHGTVSAALVATSTVTLKVTVKDPDGHVSSIATSNTLNTHKATGPSPADNASGVSTSTTLSWTVGYGATSHDVYFGSVFADVNTATTASPVFKGNQSGTTYNPGALNVAATYYWRIDEVGPGGTLKGMVWRFTTVNNNLPTFVAAGNVASGTGAITPALPANIVTGDILLLFLETANQAITIPTPNGGTWTQVTNSPQGTGTAGGSSATRLTVFWSRYNGTQGAPTTSDSGDHQLGRMIAIRGAVASGNPWDVTAGGIEATSDSSGSIPGATTTVGNTLVVAVVAASLPDATGTANFSSWANANLTSVTERTDNTVNSGNGGGLGIATGIKTAAGAYGNTTVTHASAAVKGMMSISIKP